MARSSNKPPPGMRGAKPLKSIKLTPGKCQQVEKALTDLQALYGDLVASWPQIPQAKRDEVLAHSPVLRSYLVLFCQNNGGM